MTKKTFTILYLLPCILFINTIARAETVPYGNRYALFYAGFEREELEVSYQDYLAANCNKLIDTLDFIPENIYFVCDNETINDAVYDLENRGVNLFYDINEAAVSLRPQLSSNDLLLVSLAAHAYYSGWDIYIGVFEHKEWGAYFDQFNPHRMVILVESHASAEIVPAISEADRIIITSTTEDSYPEEKFLISSILNQLDPVVDNKGEYDLDNNGLISFAEAYITNTLIDKYDGCYNDNGDGICKSYIELPDCGEGRCGGTTYISGHDNDYPSDNPDRTPPTIVNVSYSPNPIYEGDNVTLSAIVKDNTGLCKVRFIWRRNSIGYGDGITIKCSGTGPLEVSQDIGSFVVNHGGKYAYNTIIRYKVEAWDEAGNFTSTEEENISITKPPGTDITRPILTNVGHSPEASEEGRMLTLSATVEDERELGSVRFIWNVNYVDTDWWYEIWEACYTIPVTGKGPTTVSHKIGPFEYGDEIQYKVIVYDKADNYKQSSITDITIGGIAADVTPPEIVEFGYWPEYPKSGSALRLDAYLADGTGLSGAQFYFKVNGGDWQTPLENKLKGTTSRPYRIIGYFYVGDIIEYKLGVWDLAGNTTMSSIQSVTIGDPAWEPNPPTIFELSNIPAIPCGGDSMCLSVEIEDDTVLNTIKFYWKINGGNYLQQEIRSAENCRTTITHEIGSVATNDKISYYAEVCDWKDNCTTSHTNSITVKPPDVTPPTIIKLCLDPSVPIQGESIDIIALGNDNDSGLAKMKFHWRVNNRAWQTSSPIKHTDSSYARAYGIGSYSTGDRIDYKVTMWDTLGNSQTSHINTIVVQYHRPRPYDNPYSYGSSSSYYSPSYYGGGYYGSGSYYGGLSPSTGNYGGSSSYYSPSYYGGPGSLTGYYGGFSSPFGYAGLSYYGSGFNPLSGISSFGSPFGLGGFGVPLGFGELRPSIGLSSPFRFGGFIPSWDQKVKI